jgi:lipopolysaccharide cholinephosphotransferase
LEKAKREAKNINKDMFSLGLTKLKKPDSVNPLKRFIKGIVIRCCKLHGSEYYVKRIIEKANRPEQKGSRYIGTKSWCVYGERNIIPSDAFSDVTEVEFEGRMIPAPKGYDAYLTCLYGDYLPEPPKEKQKTHHVFNAYKI